MLILTRLGIPFPCPEDLADIPMAKIIDFQRKYAAERTFFRETIEGFISAFGELDDKYAQQDFLFEQRAKLKTMSDDQDKLFRDLGIANIGGLIGAVTCAALTACTIDTTGIAHGPLLATGLILSHTAVAYAKLTSDLRKAKRAYPMQYLIPLRKNFRTSQ